MHSAIKDLQLEHLWVVYPGAQEYALHEKISVIPMKSVADLLEKLQQSA
jgi:hypothetical protein